MREQDFRRKYGLSVEEYEALAFKQAYCCAICGKPESSMSNQGEVKRLAVDHCHERGVVRGLLCAKCNVGLGHFQDDPMLVWSALEYLVRS